MHLYGSQLTKKIFPDFRTPKDTDFVTNDLNEYLSLKTSFKGLGTEIHYIPNTPDREMTADELYTLKVSHAIYDIHWQKTMSDIRFFQIKGCQILPDFLSELRKHWEVVHQKKRCNFDINADKFFKDNVKRKIPHDDLHKIINPSPSYQLVVDGVKPNKEKFDRLSITDKNNICFEEAYVIALERYYTQLPFRTAYNRAQQSLVTRLHPVWIADWIILNWKDYFWTTNTDYYEIYETAINREDQEQ